jgi:predicted nucleotidyltransferase
VAVAASLARLFDILPESLAAEVRALGDKYGIRNIRVFGSFARGEARSDSALDLLVEYVPAATGSRSWSSASGWRNSWDAQ